MIELRWKKEWYGDDVVKTLQYRTWHIRLDASGAMTPTPLPIEWTEWEEVPEGWDK